MKQFVALRKTRVNNGYEHLPRPRLTQDVLLIGPKQDCQDLIERLSKDPRNLSTDEVEVNLIVVEYNNHRTHTSTELRRGNGKRRK